MPRSALLVVADEALRALLASELRAGGWEVRLAGSGQEGSAELALRQPALLVVDGLLPDTDCVRFVSGLRQSGNPMPVVCLSAFSRDLETFRRLTEDLGVALVVPKPINVHALVEQLERLNTGKARARLDAAAELDLKQAMAALKHEYARALPRKVGELAHCLYQAKQRSNDPVLVAEAGAQAHRLHGTASAYGFAEVGVAAGRIEDLLAGEDGGGPARSLGVGTWEAIEHELAEAVRLIEAGEVATAGGGEPRGGSTSLRVLAVDPDPGHLHYLVELGRQRLVDVVPVRSAGEALEAIDQQRFDAAIIDDQLSPAGGAFALALELRNRPGLEKLPLAFLSLDAQGMANRVAAAHAGASLYLCKPLDADSFSSAVHHLAAARSGEQTHVLLVDDDPDFTSQLSVLLRHERMQVTAVNDPEQVLRALDDAPVDVVLLDANMPGLSGLDVCRVLRVSPRWQDVPVLFVTSESGHQTRTAAFAAGADDYLPKPIVRDELLARIRVRVERRRMLRDRSDRDSVTGLLVRRALISGLTARLVEARRHGRPLAVCLLDLDHFKAVNDRFGHLAGDRVLASLGALLERRFRAEDLRGRWGGEEFILAFPGEGVAAVQWMVARVLEELQAVPFSSDTGEVFHVSFSAGVAVYPDDAASVDALLRAADRRLYEAKEAGRQRVVGVG